MERWAGWAALTYFWEDEVVQGSGGGRVSHGRRLVADLSTADLADAFLEGKASYCAENTIRKYRWALGCLERVYPTLPRVTSELIRFVGNEPLRSGNSKRDLWNTIRDFYSWVRETEDALVPELPPVSFGRRRVGEKRGRQGSN
jgi:hypothetical protein